MAKIDQKDFVGNSGIKKEGRLNPLQEEVCDVLREECSELAIEASKMNRCGMNFVTPDSDLTVRQKFSKEVADVLTLINEAIAADLVDLDALKATLESKPEKLRIWTHLLGNAPISKIMPDGVYYPRLLRIPS